MTQRTAALSALGLTVILTVAACGPSDRAAAPPATAPSRATATATAPHTPRTSAPPASAPPASGTPRTSAPPRRTSVPVPPGSRHPAACGTRRLRWRLTRVADRTGNAPAAVLGATNGGAVPCAFDGYPGFDVHLGKGPQVSSKPRTAARVRQVLNPGRGLDFPLYYQATASRDGSCFIPARENPRIEVRPPHPGRGDYGAPLRLTDGHGRRLRAAVCGFGITIGAPRPR
ncbi:DUF4232 domain-containing protein [Streptomyces tropicalis]|uniref:DUF4232 domain-containing protein n=1 Tax=Streptomyces tropicalis TaxID=3034234 RepID=A0ABT6ACC7_9ACTN|nr:DUF4232 domain-containing protein [Streptomyces tropicalis]MDF3302305.1 DUF4232 domain-containing protein [Streptomyces tropicalis]